MTIDQIPAAFNSPYAYGIIALLILVTAARHYQAQKDRLQ